MKFLWTKAWQLFWADTLRWVFAHWRARDSYNRDKGVCSVCSFIIQAEAQQCPIAQVLLKCLRVLCCWWCSGKLYCSYNCTLPIVKLKTASLTHHYWKKLYFGRTHYRRWQNSKNQITWKYTSPFSLYIRWGKLWSRRQSRWRATEKSKGGKLFLIPNPEVSNLKAYRCACLNSTLRKNKPPPTHTPPHKQAMKKANQNFHP